MRSTSSSRDVYHGRDILRAGIIPAERSSGTRYPAGDARQDVTRDIYAHIAGIDIVRAGPEEFYVLEDNARTPSGVSYMLENREMMMRLFPDLFARHRVAPVEHYPDELLVGTALGGAAQRLGDPTVVLLTPGMYNSAYFEHAFLADKWASSWSRGGPVCAGQRRVHAHHRGPKRVDVIYRRIDDDFLDPLAFRPDSTLGVPGLMSVYPAGNVTLANAVGTGIADDKAIYTTCPRWSLLSRRRADPEECSDLALPRAGGIWPTCWPICDELVVKEVHGSGGYGMLVGPAATRRRSRLPRAQARARELHRAADAGASTCPTYVESGLAPRHVDLRPFVLTGATVTHRARRADAGGAARGIAGGQLEPGRRHQGHLGVWTNDQAARASICMLSRTAENLYWLARYVERAEYPARSSRRRSDGRDADYLYRQEQ